MLHLSREPLDAKCQIGWQLCFFGDVQHLELIQKTVDVADSVPAGIAQFALRVPAIAKR